MFNAHIDTVERSNACKDAFKVGGRCVVTLRAY